MSEIKLIKVTGSLDRTTVTNWYNQILKQAKWVRGVCLDLSDVNHMDSAGAAFCYVIRQELGRLGKVVEFTGVSDSVEQTLRLFRVSIGEAKEEEDKGSFFEVVGDRIYSYAHGAMLFCLLVTDTFYLTVLGVYQRRLKWRMVVEQMVKIGLDSLGIVSLISLLVGLTVALQSAYQLRQFGANIFIADLIGISMTREMGPLMTAILVAGRCGAAICAEISTMVITEEVDALKVMGINPVRHLVSPRFLAITFTQPMLTIASDAIGIFGGFLIAVLYLQLGVTTFIDQLLRALMVKDIVTGLIKSIAFAWIIVFVGSHKGFGVRGGAEGVGSATTTAVVQAIFMVIAADAFFSILFYFGD